MPVLTPAVETVLVPACVDCDGVDAIAPIPVPPDPGPGDPGVTPPPFVAPRTGIRVQALLCKTVTHQPMGELRTALVEDWELDVDQEGSATVSASSWDPLWGAVAENTTSYRGRPVYEWDPKGYELAIGVDGVDVWPGVFRQPLDIGGDRVMLPAKTPEALFGERTLGRVEQTDELAGWGDFEQYAVGEEPPGLLKIPDPGHTITATVVLDSVRGKKCLELTGQGWVRTPHVSLAGQDGVGRSASCSAFAKLPVGVSSGAAVVLTKVQRADSLAPSNPDYTKQAAGTAPDQDGRWSDDPIASGAHMSPSSIIHHTWGELRTFDGHPTRYDVVTIRQGILSGALTAQPYSFYADLFIRHFQSLSRGGAPWGIVPHLEQNTTKTIQLEVPHNEHHPCSDVMAMIDSTVDGGAAWWIDPAWRARIRAQRGQVRSDLLFGPDQVLACRWAPDPGAEIDDFVADTGRGSGTTLVTSTVSQPFRPGRHRITNIVQPPAGPLNVIDGWAKRVGRVAALRHVTCEVDLRWRYAQNVAVGDTVFAPLVDGLMGSWTRPMRVVRMKWRPREMLVTCSLGTDDGLP